MTPLPRLELTGRESYVSLDGKPELIDEAVIVIDDCEEQTITIECPDALELAERLIRLVNNHAEIVRALEAAAHALRSYEYGNGAPDLARSVAAHCETLVNQTGAAA